MRIKLDENLPVRLVDTLRQLGHDVDTVMDEGLAAAADDKVWDAAQREGRFLITQDLDFSDTRKYKPGTHGGIMLIRLKEPSRLALQNRIGMLFATEPVQTWVQGVVIVTDHRLRIRGVDREKQ